VAGEGSMAAALGHGELCSSRLTALQRVGGKACKPASSKYPE